MILLHSVFMGNKGDAEKMKVLITEERYRHEAKFAEPESNPSNHNFAIAVSARRAGVCGFTFGFRPSYKVPKFMSSYNFYSIYNFFASFQELSEKTRTSVVWYFVIIKCINSIKIRYFSMNSNRSIVEPWRKVHKVPLLAEQPT